jgi:hypothetical protein
LTIVSCCQLRLGQLQSDGREEGVRMRMQPVTRQTLNADTCWLFPCCRYIVLGDGSEEEACADMMDWPFVRITLSHQPDPPAQQPAPAAAAACRLPRPTVAAGGEAGKRLRLTGDCENDDDDDDDDDDDADDDEVTGEAKTRRSSTSAAAVAAAVAGAGPGSKDSSMDGAASGAAEQASEPGRDAAAAAGPGPVAGQLPSGGRCVRADALGSAGHPLVELTAQQLLKLALSMS